MLSTALLLFACSCEGPLAKIARFRENIPGTLLIMEGNFFNSRNRYTQAISAYLKALKYAEARPYAEFGLGTAYFSLDEGAVALKRFAAALEALNAMPKEAAPELVYRIHYNSGVVQFKEGDYAGAVTSFRQALQTDGSRIEAKQNLELSLLALARGNNPSAVSSREGVAADTEAGVSALFEYIHQKEQNQWRSREWIEAVPFTGPDY
ncbi:MAG: tetratricopeptide repeat protein [Treponema sp.]|jgi:Ca-activated chloride channel family protein|nr:tetratricopeptide repeat protein [Treponema sp.]